MTVYDRDYIAKNYVDATNDEGVEGPFSFDVSYVEPLIMTIGGAKGEHSSTVYMFPALASELVSLGGIEDTTLFTKNVRFDLGNTAVNKSIRESIEKKSDHKNFPLFHNGIIILCHSATKTGTDLIIKDYAVVNGAQSITTFFKSKQKLTADLRVFVRVIALDNDDLARKITEYSNNQNAIKPRDLRSNHALMKRLQSEMNTETNGYFFEIKRGEISPLGRIMIANDEAGRVLLAFDLLEPWSCHQVYKIFDEKYSDIFGRKEVNSHRILYTMRINTEIQSTLEALENKPMAHYALTRYFLIYVLSRILREREQSAVFVRDPANLDASGRAEDYFARCKEIVATLLIDINYEVKEITKEGGTFDYKSVLKSPKQGEELADKLIKSYQKDVARNKATSFENW